MVIFLPSVQAYLDSLIPILYEGEYFGFEDAAIRYVDDLIDDVRDNLPFRPHKPAPPYFDRYGKKLLYAAFPKNKQTTWYAFFTKYRYSGETFFLVRYIANNHSVAQHL